MTVCAGPDLRATCPLLCFCVLCNTRKSQSELEARTLEEKGSLQCGATGCSALNDVILTFWRGGPEREPAGNDCDFLQAILPYILLYILKTQRKQEKRFCKNVAIYMSVDDSPLCKL